MNTKLVNSNRFRLKQFYVLSIVVGFAHPMAGNNHAWMVGWRFEGSFSILGYGPLKI